MKPIILLLVVCVVAFASTTTPKDNRVLLLPGLNEPLHFDMALADVCAAFPHPDRVRIDSLANGATFCTADIGYTARLLLVDNALVNIDVRDVKPRSRFGKWFTEQVKSLPADCTDYESKPVATDSKRIAERWTSADAEWKSVPSTSDKTVDFQIHLLPSPETLDDGMVIREEWPFGGRQDTTVVPQDQVMEEPPQPKLSPQPEFPSFAKAEGVTGRVVVQCYVDKEGVVRRWKVVKIQPAGYGFAREVGKVVPTWNFEPATVNYKPIGVWVAIPFNFKFHERPEDKPFKSKFLPR
jgi:TonB family protein